MRTLPGYTEPPTAEGAEKVSERDAITSDLRRWVKQQRADGMEELLLPDSEVQVSAATATADRGPAPQPDAALRATLLERHPAWAESPLLPLAVAIEACRRCNLGAQRGCSVPGTGHPKAKLVFVGEAPGAEEDRLGIPFVGRAGQLLDKILAAIDLKREDVHILNILKCRPPENRNPAPLEIEACRPFLEQQLDELAPGILVALGLFAGQWLTGKKLSLTKLRETGPFAYRGIPVYATYHPAALLRNPNWKRPAWEDFKIIREEYSKL